MTIHFPQTNTLDSSGLALLRRRVADLCFPTIAKGKTAEIKARFVFPRTPEGEAALKEVEEYIRTGKVAAVDRAFVERLEFPDWWERIYPSEAGSVQRVTLGPAASSEPLRVKLEVRPDTGEQVSIDYLVLRLKRAGTEEALWSSEDQAMPFAIKCLFRRSSARWTISTQRLADGVDVSVARDFLLFVSAAARGGTARLTLLEQRQTLDGSVPAGQMVAPPRELVDFVENACLIQERTGQGLTIPAGWSIPEQDLGMAQGLPRWSGLGEPA